MRKIVISTAAILVLGAVIGISLMTMAYCLPTGVMIENLKESVWTLNSEGDYPIVNHLYPGTQGDNYTDALMLSQAIFYDQSKSPLDKAIHVYREEYMVSQARSLSMILEGYAGNTLSYARYWHGAMVWLRPLLLFFCYEDIRALCAFMQVILCAIILCRLVQKEKTVLIAPFVLAFLTIAPLGSAFSLQYHSVITIMQLGVLAVISFHEQLNRGENYYYFFLLLGMLTSYFDLLTFPIVTLGMPLLFVLCNCRESYRRQFVFVVKVCAAWAIGYAVFWAMKWVVSFLLGGGENLIAEGMKTVAFHMSDVAYDLENIRMEAVRENYRSVSGRAFWVLYGLGVGYMLLPVLRRKTSVKALISSRHICILIVGLMPFVWWFVTANHAYIHSFFVHRSLSITVFAVLAWLGLHTFEGNQERFGGT